MTIEEDNNFETLVTLSRREMMERARVFAIEMSTDSDGTVQVERFHAVFGVLKAFVRDNFPR